MELKINLDNIRKVGLFVTEYIYLYFKYYKLNIIEYFGTEPKINYDYLEAVGYIKQTEDDIVLRQKAIDLFVESTLETKFVEFYSTYPIKARTDKGEIRVFRTKDLNSKQALELKAKYLKLIKEPGLHTDIIKGLNNYIASKRANLGYLVGIDVFINQKLWQLYLDLDEDNTQSIERISSI